MSVCPLSKLDRGARRAWVITFSVAIIATTTVTGEAVVASSPSARVPAQAVPPACPAAFPVNSLTAGQRLTGLTVDQGTTPKGFDATVIGVIDDGIASGLDMIVVETSSAAIDQAHGIWFGMSGSPVYTVDGDLVGAVAYGLAGASPIAGITPAAEMQKLLDGGGAIAAAPRVELTAAIEHRIVASGAATAAEAAAGLRRLPLPVAVSGTSPARLGPITRVLRRTVAGVHVYPAGRATGAPAAVDLVPGGNVAAALSYGDYTVAGVGTVTAVCDDEALLFGHPMTWSGATTLSAHQANAIFIQPDPIFSSFKVVNVGGVAGVVDQDRLAGLHTDVGATPRTSRVHTALTATDTGVSRTATTRVVLPEFIPSAVFGHVLTNLDRVHDRIGAGVVELTWAASGKRSDDSTWRLRRREKVADPFDATFPAADLIAFPVFRLFDNRFEEITVDNVTVSGTVDPNFTQGQLIGLDKLGANGRWHAVSRQTPLRLVAGSEVFLRGVFRQHRSDRLRRVQLSFVVPRWVGSRGTLVISAGVNFFDFFFEEELDESGGPENFDQLLNQIDKAATGDTVRAELHLARRVPGVGRQTITRHARATAPTAVQGNLFFEVQVVSPAG